MFKTFSLTHVSAGFVAILVGYSSAAAIVYQGALSVGATTEQAASWMWALGIGLGLCGIALSLYYQSPVALAWSTPGAALLAAGTADITLSDATGAFIFSSFLLLICGLSGLSDKLMKLVPQSLATAMLAGILIRFGLDIFPAFEQQKVLVGAMLVTYLFGLWRKSPFAIPLTFVAGILITLLNGSLKPELISLELTEPVFVLPTLNISALIGLGVPLFIVTMASQNFPGIAVLRAHNYDTPASPIIAWTGGIGILLAPFGGFAYNLAAITAALCMGKDVDPDPKKRYWATVWAGVFYMVAGFLGLTVITLFSAFPHALIAAIAGLALLGTIANSLASALTEAKGREAAILTFIITASSGTFLSIATPFWGLVTGLIVHYIMQSRSKDPY